MEYILIIFLIAAMSFFRFTYKDRENDKTSYVIAGIIVLVIWIVLIATTGD